MKGKSMCTSSSRKRISGFWVSCFVILCFVFLVRRSSGADDFRYKSCVEKHCEKGPKIKFPFYITGEQEAFCGLFRIYCGSGSSNNGGYPMISLSDNEYVITEISYENRSFWVHNAAVDTIPGNCLLNFRNVTPPQPSMSIVSSSSLHLLSRCVGEIPRELEKYKVACDNDTADRWELAILGDDENLSSGIRQCRVDVVAPVELRGDEGRNGAVADNIEGVLRRGFALNWTSRDCTRCEQSGGHCGIEPTTNGFRCYCSYGGFEYTICKSTEKKIKSFIIIVTAVPTCGVALIVVILVFFCNKRKLPLYKILSRLWKGKTDDDDHNHDVEAILKKYRSVAPRRYSYSELKKMTNSFEIKLGQGGYGSVYKGKFQDGTGTPVAVKILTKESNKGNGEEFINEVVSISRTSHVNVVTLLGFCFQGHGKKALIYEFMENGSLDKFIYGQEKQLDWPRLYKIAVGIARGLEYLHRGCNTRILHFDIKPHNILLDGDFVPKISDFGLAKLVPGKENTSALSSLLTTAARGTIGYIAPEVIYRSIGGVSRKSDVYSYGMMVLEMVGERRSKNLEDGSSEIYFPDWIYKRLDRDCDYDQELGLSGTMLLDDDDEEGNSNENVVRKMIIVSLWCIQTHPSNRPTISKVLDMLEGPLEALRIPPKPSFSSLAS